MEQETDNPFGLILSRALSSKDCRTTWLAQDAKGARWFVKRASGDAVVGLHNEHATLIALAGGEQAPSVLGFVQTADAAWLATAWLDGVTLEALIASPHGPPRDVVAATALAGVAQESAQIHAAGWVHGDIKASNALVRREGVRLVDFACARRVGDEGRGDRGTAEFLAPERIAMGAVQPGWDVYAIGVLGFWLLSGRYPFESKDERKVMAAISFESPPAVGTVVPKLDAGLAGVVDACLATEPSDRPTADALHTYLSGLSCYEPVTVNAWRVRIETEAAREG